MSGAQYTFYVAFGYATADFDENLPSDRIHAKACILTSNFVMSETNQFYSDAQAWFQKKCPHSGISVRTMLEESGICTRTAQFAHVFGIEQPKFMKHGCVAETHQGISVIILAVFTNYTRNYHSKWILIATSKTLSELE